MLSGVDKDALQHYRQDNESYLAVGLEDDHLSRNPCCLEGNEEWYESAIRLTAVWIPTLDFGSKQRVCLYKIPLP